MENRRLISRFLIFTVLVLCLSLSPIISAQKTKQRRPTTQTQATNQAAQQTAQACCSLGSWNLTTHLGPGHREKMAMAYDSSRHRVVVFGGWSFNGNVGARLGDTWEWDGSIWTLKATTGPAPRYETAMAYDVSHGRVVLFGGNTAGGLVGDTWEWDGIAWTPKLTIAGLARSGHAMAYDSVRGKVIMFGGSYMDPNVYEWNGPAWTGIAVSTYPPARQYHGLVSDSARGRVVMFGGMNASGVSFGDTWEWNGASWTQKSTTGPSRRIFPAMAFSTACGKVMLFGGLDGTSYFGDTWQWDGSAWTQTSATGPAPRVCASMEYDSQNQQIVLFGGFAAPTLPYSDETWTINTVALSADFQLSATSPSGNPATYQVTATNAPLGNGVSFWWKVEEIDVSTGAVVPNTTMINPSAWWANPTTNVFSGYYNNSSPIGLFYQGHKYRISHGVWNSCNPWLAVSKTVFMCNNCRTPEMKNVPSIKIKPKLSGQ